jgi:hypothetical protein
MFGIGPKLGYFADSDTGIPFLAGGVNYLSRGTGGNSEGGFGIQVGGGMIIRKGAPGGLNRSYLFSREFQTGWIYTVHYR